MFYILVYLVTMFFIFSFLLSFRIFNYPFHYQSRYLNNLMSLGTYNPVLALSFSFTLFSMVGIPPFVGFFAKFFIFFTALQTYSLGLSLVGVVVSGITCFYYIRLIKEMYFISDKN